MEAVLPNMEALADNAPECFLLHLRQHFWHQNMSTSLGEGFRKTYMCSTPS